MPGGQNIQPVTNPRVAKLIELEVSGRIKPEHQLELDTYRAQGLAPKKSSGNSLTEYQGKSTGFYERASGADTDFLAAGEGGEPVGLVGEAARAALPTGVVNSLTSPARQKAEQAKKDFILASLRYESGAAISQGELEGQEKTFFPQTGDGPDVIAQKAAARRRVIDSLKVAAGPGASSKPSIAPGNVVGADAPERTPTSAADKAHADEEVKFGDEARTPLGKRPTPQLEAAIKAAMMAGDVGEAAHLMEQFTGIPTTDSYRKTLQDTVNKLKAPGALYGGIEKGVADETAQAKADFETYGNYRPEAESDLKAAGELGDLASGGRALSNTATAGIYTPVEAGLNSLIDGTSFTDEMRRSRSYNDMGWKVNPKSSIAGTVIGAAMIPTRSGAIAAAARNEALTGGAAVREAMAAGRNAGALQLGKEGGIYGAAYGTSENLDRPDRISRGLVSGGLGAVGGYTGGQVLGRIADRFSSGRNPPAGGGAPIGAEAAPETAQQAANALDITMPRFVSGGPATQQAAAVLEKTPFGIGPIRKGVTKFLETGQAARDKIASEVGEPSEAAAMGDRVVGGAKLWRRGSKANVSSLYREAEGAVGDSMVSPRETTQEVGKLIREEGESLAETDAMGVLDKISKRLENGDAITVEGARKTRSTLRDALGLTMTPSNADRVTNRVMGAIQKDIERDAPQAAGLYRVADKAHAERMTQIRDVLEPFIGKKGDNWGADVAKRIIDNSTSNGERLDEMLKLMPKEVGNEVRATLISKLGRSRDGAQNAAGDAFSFDEFLTNWNQLRDARARIFPRETVRALDQLATVAEAAKKAGRTRNYANTGSIIGMGATFGPAMTGTVPGALASVGMALGQFGGAKLLASPAVVRRLSNIPETAAGAERFWKGPWVEKLARSEPSIAADLTGLRDFIVRSLPGAAAADEQPKGERVPLPKPGEAQK